MKKIVKGFVVLIDKIDEEKFNQSTWGITRKGYVRSYSRKLNRIMLHRHLLGVTDQNLLIDHKNRNKLDNRRGNLRLCNNSENLRNRPGVNGRKLKGVIWDKSRKKFRAAITVNYKCFFLGRFNSEKDAAMAYNKAAIIHFGKFAYLNAI